MLAARASSRALAKSALIRFTSYSACFFDVISLTKRMLPMSCPFCFNGDRDSRRCFVTPFELYSFSNSSIFLAFMFFPSNSSTTACDLASVSIPRIDFAEVLICITSFSLLRSTTPSFTLEKISCAASRMPIARNLYFTIAAKTNKRCNIIEKWVKGSAGTSKKFGKIMRVENVSNTAIPVPNRINRH